MVTQQSHPVTSSDFSEGITAGGTGLNARGMPLQWRWLLPVSVIAATAAWVAGVGSGGVGGATRVALMVTGAMFTAVAAGVPLWQQARAARSRADAVAAAQSARATMRIALEDALDPFTALLLQLTTAKGVERARLRGEAIQLALTSMAQLSAYTGPGGLDGPRRVRVCYFALEQGRTRRLVPRSYAGRSGAPTVAFDDTTRAGQFLLRIVDDGWLIVDDTAQMRVSVWWDDERAHRTFAAGPVPGADGEPVGLITLDALEPGELAGLDLPLVRLITHLLSVALQV